MNFLSTLFTVILITASISTFAASSSEIQLPLTKQSAAELVKSKSPGKVLSVDEKTEKGNTIFVIKIVDKNGKVKIFSIDAETGRQIQ